MVFDAESKSLLHTEMAKKNLFVKRGELFNIAYTHQKPQICYLDFLENDTHALIL